MKAKELELEMKALENILRSVGAINDNPSIDKLELSMSTIFIKKGKYTEILYVGSIDSLYLQVCAAEEILRVCFNSNIF